MKSVFFFFFLRVVLGLGLSHVLAHLLWSYLNEGFLSWHLANLGFGFQTLGYRIVLSFVREMIPSNPYSFNLYNNFKVNIKKIFAVQKTRIGASIT